MKKSFLVFALYSVLTIPTISFGQGNVPESLNELIGLPLDDVQEKLQTDGHEIAHSSLFKKINSGTMKMKMYVLSSFLKRKIIMQ